MPTVRPSRLGGWTAGLAGSLTAGDPQSAVSALASGLECLVSPVYAVAGFFRRDEVPIFVKYTNEAWVRSYIGGYYLLDPIYEQFLAGAASFCLPLRDVLLPGRRGSDFFRDLYQHRHWYDEISYLLCFGADSAGFVSLIRRADEPDFTPAELEVLASVLPGVERAMERVWIMLDPHDGHERAQSRRLHRIMSAAFRSFGSDVLTPREVEVAQLLLKGCSPKAVGRMLDISPGTVRNHIKRIYVKVNVHSQPELLAHFLETLDSAVAQAREP